MYIIKAVGLSLPAEGSLGEAAVLARAANLKSDFADIMVWKEVGFNEFVPISERYRAEPKAKSRLSSHVNW